ncbi:MAG: insulinase family protein [Undibacterium sp.]|nr:insulinase family protein [Opitutaceae bacterium]
MLLSSPRLTRLFARCFLTATVLVASLRAAEPAKSPTPVLAPAFVQAASDLTPDPAVRYGTLPNGLRYVLLHNNEPKGRASLRLRVGAGSFHETEDQRGLAHFLEHMAFNGSTHYAPGTLVEFFQRMGMSFGGDTNAFTSFEQTVYMLELPNATPATLAEGLRVFSDYAGGLLLQPGEIDKERGIILSEKRTRDSVGFRTLVAQFEFLLADTLLPKRLPIGLVPVIEKAPRERFADFYDTWYRPDLITVVAVGDFEVSAVEAQITPAFGPLASRAAARPAPDRGHLTAFTGVRAFYHSETEAPSTSVSISTLTPYAAEPDTAANRLQDLPRDLATAIVNRRLSILAKKEGAPFVSGRTSVGESYDLYREASIDLTCKADQWSAALAIADQELRRALTHGFSATELREITANYVNSLEQSVKTASTRHSNALADDLVESVNRDNVFTTPAADLALFKPALAAITPADCLAALRAAWAPAGRYVSVTGNALLPAADSANLITAAYDKSADAAVAAPPVESDTPWAYTDFGPAGSVVTKTTVADLDLTLVTFANGVRLNLKKTDFEAGRIRVSVRIGDGQITEPQTQPGLSSYAGNTFNAGGLGRHSSDELRRILAGKTVGAGFGIASDAFMFSGGTNRDDLLLGLQLITAQLTDPGYRPEAARQAAKSYERLYNSLAHTTNGPLTLEVTRLLANGDSRFGLPAQAVIAQRTPDEVRAWLTPQFATGPMEVSLIGDLDLDATIAAVAQTFGALPKRDAKAEHADLRKVTFPAEPFIKNYTVETEIPKGLVALFWPTTDALDIRRTRRLSMLANVLTDRLRVKVREELGGAYSPSAASSPSDTYPGYGFLAASVTVEPAKARKISDVVVALAADLATKGVTADELDRAKQPVLTAVRESVRNNGYWLSAVLSRAQEKPETLDWSRNRIADIESITPAELTALAQHYFPETKPFRVTVLPAAKTESAK